MGAGVMQRDQFTFYNGAVDLQFVLMQDKTDLNNL